MAGNALLQRLGIEHPILLAPMAGSGGTPELAAAVSNAGGLGAWGGAYSKPDEMPLRSVAFGSSPIGLSISTCSPAAIRPMPRSTRSRCWTSCARRTPSLACHRQYCRRCRAIRLISNWRPYCRNGRRRSVLPLASHPPRNSMR